jgi:hypothetical protein
MIIRLKPVFFMFSFISLYAQSLHNIQRRSLFIFDITNCRQHRNQVMKLGSHNGSTEHPLHVLENILVRLCYFVSRSRKINKQISSFKLDYYLILNET